MKFSKLPITQLSFKSKYISLIITVIIFIIIILVRIIYIIQWQTTLDGDESVVGIMAKHILEGKSLPIFFYGQSHMGTLEQFTAAFFFFLFSIHPIVLKCVPLFYFTLTIIFYSLIIKKYLHFTVNKTLLYITFPPLFYIVWSTKARGGFIEIVFLMILFLYLLFTYQKSKKNLYLYFLSLLAGFSLYTNMLSLPFLAYIIFIFLLDKRRGSTHSSLLDYGKKWVLSCLFFICGISPALFFILTHKKPMSVTFGLGVHQGFIEKITLLFSRIIPMVLGGAYSTNKGVTLFSMAEIMLAVLYGFSIIITFFIYKDTFLDLIRFRHKEYPKEIYIILLFPVYICVLLLSRYLIDIQSVRYLLFFIVAFPIYLECTRRFLHKKCKYLSIFFLVLVIFSGIIASSQIFFISAKAHTITYSNLMYSRDYHRLFDFLYSHNFTLGYADYWIQWDINFLSKEKLIFVSDNGVNRYKPYVDIVKKCKYPVYIYYEENNIIRNDKLKWLKEKYNAEYTYKTIDDFLVFYPLIPRNR